MAAVLIISGFLFALRNPERKLIESWCRAVTIFVALAYFSVEFFSLFRLVNRKTLSVFWAAVFLVILILTIQQGKKNRKSFLCLVVRLVRTIKHHGIWFILAAGLLLLAVWTVPYNWDSMTYHLSRIANWAQNRSVAHYATHNIRELVSPGLAEFINLHVYILTGKKDIFFNLLQCLSAVTNVWLVYEISRKMGCTEKYASLAALICFSSPSAFGEALSTQVDQFAAVWLLIFVYYYMELLKQKLVFSRRVMSCCGMMAVCIAFGYLTKPSVLIGMAVFLLVLFIVCFIRRAKFSFIVGAAFSSGAVALTVVLPEAIRNILSFGSLSLPIAGQRQLVGTLNPLYVFVNGLKNFVFNLPNIYMYNSDHWMAAVVYRISDILGVSIDDPAIAEDGRAFLLHPAQTYDPDLAVNPIIVLTFLFYLIWGIISFRRQRKQEGYFYSVLISGIFLVFCCVVRWEPFVSRYMVSYLALLCPVAAYEIQDFTEQFRGKIRGAAPYVLISAMCCVELFGLGIYHTRIALSEHGDRFRGYFYARQSIYEDYKEVCDSIAGGGPEKIGLILEQDSYEYPIWQAMNGHAEEIRHVMVENESSPYEAKEYVPDVMLVSSDKGDKIKYGSEIYYRNEMIGGNGGLWLYEMGKERE